MQKPPEQLQVTPVPGVQEQPFQQFHALVFADACEAPATMNNPIRQSITPVQTVARPIKFIKNIVNPFQEIEMENGSSEVLPSLNTNNNACLDSTWLEPTYRKLKWVTANGGK